MAQEKWIVTYKIYRQKGQDLPHHDHFKIDVDPEEYILDGIERIWAFRDRTLTYRHACHHSACGACGMRINGAERLACITPLKDVTHNGGTIRVEPLRNFEVVSDLVVEMSHFYLDMEDARYSPVISLTDAPLSKGIRPEKVRKEDEDVIRLSDCLECGMCISACPTAATSRNYHGPAIMAALQTHKQDMSPDQLKMADSHEGVWGCHSAYECTDVCPSYVEPAWRIMDLRREIVKRKISGLFSKEKK